MDLRDRCAPARSDLDDASAGEITFTGFDRAVIDIEFSPDRSLAAAIAPLP